MIRLKQTRSDGYVVLITVLILGIVVTTIAEFLLLSGTSASRASTAVNALTGAKAGALGCTQLALGAIQANKTLATPASDSKTLDAATNEQCTYTITGSSPNYTIVAVGTVTNNTNVFTHQITATTSGVSPKVFLSSWQESP